MTTERKPRSLLLTLFFSLTTHINARQEDVRSKFLYLGNPEATSIVWDYQHHMHAPSHETLTSRSQEHEAAVDALRRESEHTETEKADTLIATSENSSFAPTDPRPFFLRQEYPAARVVEFYSPWCGHCQNFAPHYIQMACEVLQRVLSSNGPGVEFYAVSCSEHHHLCQQQNVSGYPSIRAYHARSTEYSTVQPFTLESIEHSLQLGIDTTPVAPAGGQNQHIAGLSSSKTGMLALGDGDDTRSHPSKIDILGATLDGYRRTRTDVFRDAALSFTYAMEHHIYLSDEQPLSSERAAAFSEWLDLLYWTLPPTWMLHALIHDLRRNLQQVVQSKISLLELVHKHHEVVHETSTTGSDDKVQWSVACGGNSGFGCGLWRLMHVASIGVVERHRAVLGARDRVSTSHAAETMYHYVYHFSSWCHECREIFLQRYEMCAYRRCKRFQQPKSKMPPSDESWKEFPMWLWQMHGGINEAIVGTRSKKKNNRKATGVELSAARWPTETACQTCQKRNGRWSEADVFAYLRKEYWPGGVQNFRYVVLDKNDRSKEREDDSSSGMAVRVFVAIALSVTAVLVYASASRSSQRVRIRATGRHKKFDDGPNGPFPP